MKKIRISWSVCWRGMILLIIACIPIVLLVTIEKLMPLFHLDKEMTFNFLIAIFPFVFSGISLMFGNIVKVLETNKTETKDNKDMVNQYTMLYNKIELRMQRKYNDIMNDLAYLFSINEYFMKTIEFKSFIDVWTHQIKNDLNYSNDMDFRCLMQNCIEKFITQYKNSDFGISVLDYMGNIAKLFYSEKKLCEDDLIYIYKLKYVLKLTQYEKDLFECYCSVFEDGSASKRIFDEFQAAIDEYTICLDAVLSKSIDPKKLHGLLYTFFLKFFYLLENLLTETFLLDKFVTSLSQAFNIYIEEQKKEFKTLDVAIKIEEVNENKFSKMYLSEKCVFAKCGIDIL
jgi:hypothetical protein